MAMSAGLKSVEHRQELRALGTEISKQSINNFAELKDGHK